MLFTLTNFLQKIATEQVVTIYDNDGTEVLTKCMVSDIRLMDVLLYINRFVSVMYAEDDVLIIELMANNCR